VSVADLDFERKRRTNDNVDLTPRDLLRLALEDMDKGEYPRAAKCMILILDESEEGGLTQHPYRCGMTRTDEIAHLEAWKLERLESWRS
jgi:hypothetical protein